MPEEPEAELTELREEHAEEAAARGMGRAIALTTALFAALAAVAALRAGATVNEALLLKTEAAQLQNQASDQWSAYQAKSIKAAIQQGATTAWLAAGKKPPPTIAREVDRYASEERTIADKAHQFEHELDEKAKEADHLLHAHHRFADAVALFQIAIALGAIAALTRVRVMWFGSLAVGVAGSVLFFGTIL